MIKELLTKYLDTQKIQYETHVDLKRERGFIEVV